MIRWTLLAALLAARTAIGGGPPTDEVDTCLSCHGDAALEMKLPSGETEKLFVDRAVFEKSVHGAKLGCVGCHVGHEEYPHPELKAKDRAQLVASFRDACRSCHFDNYAKALDGVHYKLAAKGDSSAPGCVDCHGSHDIARPGRPRAKVSETCSACHSEVAEKYGTSVHGLALAEGSQDVPVCTDCHRSHDIANPHQTVWKVRAMDACARCHGDAKRMEKYGLSTAVMKTYLADFHGMSASFSGSQSQATQVPTALCMDCHGVHDIQKVRGGEKALQANLVATCRKCHKDASESFPAAWLSHYEPSPKRAPLVWAVGVFYKVFIPFVIGGLILQILLSLWRVMVNR